jgi:hypothetical protein
MVAVALVSVCLLVGLVVAAPNSICIGVAGSNVYEYRANLTTVAGAYSFFAGVYDFRPTVDEAGAVTIAVMKKEIAYHEPMVTMTVFYGEPYAWKGVRLFQFPIDAPSAGTTWMSLVNDSSPIQMFDERAVPMVYC